MLSSDWPSVHISTIRHLALNHPHYLYHSQRVVVVVVAAIGVRVVVIGATCGSPGLQCIEAQKIINIIIPYYPRDLRNPLNPLNPTVSTVKTSIVTTLLP